ncbi:hypothetical protein GCM10027184_65370 [Saccharothrix stipae]
MAVQPVAWTPYPAAETCGAAEAPVGTTANAASAATSTPVKDETDLRTWVHLSLGKGIRLPIAHALPCSPLTDQAPSTTTVNGA